MTRAYNELYLSDAKDNLADYFDYLVNDCGFDIDWAAMLFEVSGYAYMFENGNPYVLSGMSGVELAREVVKKTYQGKELPEPTYPEELSPEYWAGWALAEYQWYSGRRFKDILEHVKMSEVLSMYKVYHEMDITQFVDEMERRCSQNHGESRLKKLRENRGLSQSQLAERSGVGLRSIQMYEQRVNDIDKAQAQTIYKLSRAIGCRMEDLMEDPRA